MFERIVKSASTIFLLVLCVSVFGWMSYASMPREAAPEVKIPNIIVSTPYVGVSPADIESLITNPLENELTNVKGLKKMQSTSAEGVSIVNLEFEPEVEIEDALQRVRDAAGKAKPKLPEDAEETQIVEISFSDVPVMLVNIAGPVDGEQLKDLAEDLEEKLERVEGVLEVDISGGRTREIHVEVDPIRLEHYGFSLDDVIGAINNENVNVPGGDVVVGDANVLLRVPGEFVDPAEIEDVAIKRQGDRPVFVRDVARVVDSFAERTTYSRMNGLPAVTLGVKKRTGANLLNIADEVRRVTGEEAESWPPGVEYALTGDQSKVVRDMVADLENGILTALVLVMGVLVFFMGIRNSLFVAVAIPLSFMLSMIVISLLGMTLNMIVLFALILALGMLVDNAIVLVENIYRHVEEGADLFTASVEGTREVALPVAASTATTVAAFLPLVFWSGIMGQFMGYMPKTVIIVLVASLVVAIVVLPVATSLLMKVSPKARAAAERRKTANDDPYRDDAGAGAHQYEEGEQFGPVMRLYRRVLEASIRFRYLSAGLGVVTLVGTFMIYAEYNHGTEFFPATEPDQATVGIELADGMDLETTDAIAREVEAILAEEENIEVWVTEVGVSGNVNNPMEGTSNASNKARITIDFLPNKAAAKPGEKARVENTFDTINRLRAAVVDIPGAKITINPQDMGPPVGAPIGVEVSGEDFDATGEFAMKVRRDLAEIEGTADLSDNYKVGRPELRLNIDRGAAKRVGASTQAVAGSIRTAVAGTKATSLRDGEDEYDVIVRVDDRARDDLQSVLAMRIPGREDTSPDTYPVPLSTVASYELSGGSGSIRHIDQKKVVTITGNIAEGYNENAVREQVIAYIESAEVPQEFQVRLGGANDEQREAQEFLSRAFLLAIFLIAIVLVSQFNRFDLPLIILASVVLSLIGVLWGLMLTGTPFGIMMTGLGVISLAGVVVNNAIVLLDYVEQLRSEGREVFDALVRAGTVRFRPVILTAMTTVLGLVPMAMGFSVDFFAMKIVSGSTSSQWWGAMAVAVIFGLAVATVLTLVMVPTMYSIIEDFRWAARRVFRREAAKTAIELRTTDVVAGVDPGSSVAGASARESLPAGEPSV